MVQEHELRAVGGTDGRTGTVAVQAAGRSQAVFDSSLHAPVATGPRPGFGTFRLLGVAARVVIVAVAAIAGLWLLLIVAYKFIDPPFSTLMLGKWLSGASVEQQWVRLDQISPNLIRAVVMAEDARFCQHRGVDWEAIDEAIDKAEDGKPRGASTISMQTVKNLLLWPQPHYVRKAIEIPLTYLADRWWGKRRMLELYLNVAEWGPGVFGAEAAAREHFSKPASALTQREAALLAVSLPNPITRQAGKPGPGTSRLAGKIQSRAASSAPYLPCVLGRR